MKAPKSRIIKEAAEKAGIPVVVAKLSEHVHRVFRPKRELGRCTFCGSTVVIINEEWTCLMCRTSGDKPKRARRI